MFTSIVVALDLEATGDRALPLAGSLATLGGLPIELVTVSSPGLPPAVDEYELERRASAHGLIRDAFVVLHDVHVGTAIVDHMRSRPGALLVMGTTAKGPFAEHVLGSVSEYVLGHSDSPVLVVGPRAAAEKSVAHPRLIVCVGDSDRADIAAPVVTSWVRTFGGGPTRVVHVPSTQVRPAEGESDGGVAGRHLAERLVVAEGIDCIEEELPAGDPATVLERASEAVDDAVLVAVSSRWTDAHFHRQSVTRQLAQRSTRPVLVIPGSRGETGDRTAERLSA